MHKVTLNSLFLSFSILSLAALAGWLLADKVVGRDSGFQFLGFSLAISSALGICKIIIFSRARNLVFYQLLFIGGFGVDLAWFLSCFFLPLFWVQSIPPQIKWAVFSLFVFVCIENVRFGRKIFDKEWSALSDVKFEKIFASSGNSMNWEELSISREIMGVLFLPGIPRRFVDGITVVIFVLLILGFSLRTNSPILSMIFLGFPFSIATAYFLQVSSYHFSEANKVAHIQRFKKIEFKASV